MQSGMRGHRGGSTTSRVPAKQTGHHHAGQRHRVRLRASSGANASNGSPQNLENVVIVGSGPAGYTAAIYAARANLKPVVFEGVAAGGVRGGQLMTTNEVENFPGFPQGITGPDLMDRMRDQAARWGAELFTEDVVSIDTSQRPFVVRSDERTYATHAVILATGATAKRLHIPSEDTYWSRGISACAICDGASPVFSGQEVAVVGGGDSATEEAHYITKYARTVHLLVRGARMRASRTMQDRVTSHPRVKIHYSTAVVDAYGDSTGLRGVTLEDTESGEQRDLPLRGLFYGIGHRPNSDLVQHAVELDDMGYVKVQNDCETSVPGVFAAGDLHDKVWRQAVTAAASGCASAIAAERYLAAHGLLIEHSAMVSVATHKAVAESAPEPAQEEASAEAPFDPARTKHRGQYALRKLYHESDRLIAVMFTSPTCGPCRTMKPMIHGVVDEYEDSMYLVEIDMAQDPEIAEAAGVSGTPTVQCFKDKDRVETISGVKMKSEWRKIFGKYIDGGNDGGGSDSDMSTSTEAAVPDKEAVAA